MNKNQKIIIYGGAAAQFCLVALVVALIISNANRTEMVNEALAETENLRLANDRLLLTNEFNQLNADFNQYEDQQRYLKNDSLVKQYNEARLKVEGLLSELNLEKQSNAANRKRIRDLEAEISTLKGIVKHYLEEIQRLGEENEGLKREIEQVTQRNEQLASQVSVATSQNEQLTATVQLAKKLNITNVSLRALNRKDKPEKNVTKAKKLQVDFVVSPNNTAAAGNKDFFVRITSPEGSLLGGERSFHLDGSNVPYTMSRQVEYSNEELPVSLYWDVNTTLTPGDYTVEIFSDGYRLASRHFTLRK